MQLSDALLLLAMLVLSAQLYRTKKRILKKMSEIDDALTALEAEVTELTDAKDATLALLARILQELQDALASGGNAAERLARVQAVVTAVDANQQALAQAVADNTVPPEPTP